MSESSESRPNKYDPITYHHWQEFELRRLKRSSEDFQQLFEDIMVRAKPGFVRVRHYGNIGDRKCDGLFRQDSIFFQVYSPDELGQAKVQKKIDEDLDGAVSHWGESIKTWVFVYNVKRGVSPGILDTLQEKQKQYPNIKINHLSNDDLWEITRNLSIERRNEILGLPPLNTQTEQIAAYLVHNEDYKIKWRETCRDLLSHWKGLTTNALMRRSGVRFQVNEIFVPLGVIERREKSKHRSNDGASAEQGSELYEEKITPISQNNFFEQVLRQRQSKHSQGKRIAIIGEPGAGKTTQLQKIGDWILEETDGIPIWIPLAEVGARKLREYLLDDWLQTAIQELEVSPEHRDELGQLLKTGKVWLLLDGVDEMAISDALYQIATQMREGWLQNVRVVLTCRLNVWDAGKNALDGFDVYRNLDFEYPIEVHQLVDKWFAAEPALQQKLKVALEQPGKERIRDMAKNPLRLTLLCYSWELRQGELPETKAGLYEWFVDAFYEWNKGKVPIKLSAAKCGELNQALGELAKEAIDQETSRFRLREKFISHFLGAADDEDSLFYLALQLGWLNRIGIAAENPLESVYAFFHPTFQEYFAALAIDNWDFLLPHDHVGKPIQGREYRIFLPYWREPIVLWSGHNKNRDQIECFLEKLIKLRDSCGGYYFLQSYFLASAITAEFYSEYSDEIISNLIEWHFNLEDVCPPCSTSVKSARNEALLEANHKILIKKLKNRNQAEYELESVLIQLKLKDRLKKFIPWHSPPKFSVSVDSIEIKKKLPVLAEIIGFNSDETVDLPNEFEILEELLSIIPDSGTFNEIIQEINDIDVLVGLLKSPMTFNSPNDESSPLNMFIAFVRNHPSKNKPLNRCLFSQIQVIKCSTFEKISELASDDSKIISKLTSLFDSSQDEDMKQGIIWSLGKIAQNNRQATAFLLEVLETTIEPILGETILHFLGKITRPELLELVVRHLRKYEDTEVEDILWHCAQNMKYSDFYLAWNSSSNPQP